VQPRSADGLRARMKRDPRTTLNERHGGLLLLVSMFAVAVVGWGVQVVSPGPEGARFLDNVEASIWVYTNCALLALSVAVGWASIKRLAYWARLAGWTIIVGACLLYVALASASYLVAEASTASFHHPISDHALRVALLFAVVFAGSLPAFAILVAIMASFHSQVWSRFAARLSAGKRIHEALRARGHMQRALAGLASLVAGAVLATGAYRIAVLAHDPNSEIPTIQVLAYGAMFTAILAAVYIPAYMGWQDRVAELRDDLYPIPEPGIIRHDWMEDRSAFEALVHVNVTAGAAFKTAFAVFAPLAAALLTVVIPV
jgi:hypothetical protein